MMYFARMIARDRLYVEALTRGDIKRGTPEAEQFWRTMHITIDQRDVQHVPDWIASVNMFATLIAVVLLIWGGIAVMF